MRDPAIWNSIYSSQEDSFSPWGERMDPGLRAAIDALPTGSRVIDLGSGDGRYSAYAAEMGHSVTAIDFSESAISRLRKRCADRPVNALVADLRDPLPGAAYDLLVCTGVLNTIADIDLASMLRRFAAITKPGGCHYITVFATDSRAQGPSELNPTSFRNREIVETYERTGWSTLSYKEFLRTHSHEPYGSHSHYINCVHSKRHQ